MSVFASTDNKVGVTVLSPSELQEVLNQIASALSTWNQSHDKHQSWNYTAPS